MSDKHRTDEQRRYTEHQILANGMVIYSGPGWVQAFLDAGMNPNYGTIAHMENGEQKAIMGPQPPAIRDSQIQPPEGQIEA